MSKSTMIEKQKNERSAASNGPVVKWCPSDLLKNHPPLFVAYYSSSFGLHFMNLLGTVVGGASYAVGLYRPYPSALATMGTTGLYAGAGGSALGLSMFLKGAARDNEHMIQRRDGLADNFLLRVMDLSTWSGVGLAASAMAMCGGPTALGLSPGKLGWLQGMSLGVAVGTTSAIACRTCVPVQMDLEAYERAVEAYEREFEAALAAEEKAQSLRGRR